MIVHILWMFAGFGLGFFLILVVISLKREGPAPLPRELVWFWKESMKQKDDELTYLREMNATLSLIFRYGMGGKE